MDSFKLLSVSITSTPPNPPSSNHATNTHPPDLIPGMNAVSSSVFHVFQTTHRATASYVCTFDPGVAIRTKPDLKSDVQGPDGVYLGDRRDAVEIVTGTDGNEFIKWKDGGFCPLRHPATGQPLFQLDPKEVRI